MDGFVEQKCMYVDKASALPFNLHLNKLRIAVVIVHG